MTGLASFGGRVIPSYASHAVGNAIAEEQSEELTRFLEVADAELNDGFAAAPATLGALDAPAALDAATAKSFESIVSSGQPLPFTGLFVNPLTVDRFVARSMEAGMMVRERVQCIDVFGLVYRTHVVVRIEGWKPSFLVLVPAGVRPRGFFDLIYSAALASSRHATASRGRAGAGAGAGAGSRKRLEGDITYEVVTMPEFASFQFGMDRTFLRISADCSTDAKMVAAAAVKTFRDCWMAVDTLTRLRRPAAAATAATAAAAATAATAATSEGPSDEIDGMMEVIAGSLPSCCSAVSAALDLRRHAEEEHHYPLRFTGSLDEREMPYHFMAQEDLPLIGHLLIRSYARFNPSEEGIKYRYGVRVCYGLSACDGRPSLGSALPPIERRVPATIEEDFFRNVLCCSYDIETALSRTRGHKFSDPKVEEDSIMTIGMPIYRLSRNVPELRIALITRDHPSAPLDKTLIIECMDEADMIHVFSTIIGRLHVSIVTGFNIDEFDNRYLYLRASLHGLDEEFVAAFSEYDPPRDVVFRSDERFKMDNGFKSGLHRPSSTQRATIDAFLRLAKLRPKEFQEGASLSKMLAWYRVKDPETSEDAHKMDMPIKRMYELWDQNEPEGIREIIRYCVVDACTTYLLLYWINFFTEMLELTTMSYTTLLDSFHRADGRRVTQLLVRYSRVYGFAFCDELPPREYRVAGVEGKIGGGDVKSLAPGLQHFIISLDFKSEYPAQKEAFNIGSSAKVMPGVIADPASYGLVLLRHDTFVDQYCGPEPEWQSRERYWLCSAAHHDRFIAALATASPANAGLTREQETEVLSKAAAEGWVYEVQQFWAEASDAGKPKRWKTYFVQSPRDGNGQIVKHYSIQAKMLDDLRAERDRMKAEMRRCGERVKTLKACLTAPSTPSTSLAQSQQSQGEAEAAKRRQLEAEKAKLEADVVTYNSRQNATKVEMNSEYGTGNNAIYPHFDQDVAATVTWCSRRLAEFLRRVLTCHAILVPDYVMTPAFLRLLEEGSGRSDGLTQYGFRLVSVTAADATATAADATATAAVSEDAWKAADGSVLINTSIIAERAGAKRVKRWYYLLCPPSSLTYQDTDSNYYRVPAIASAATSSAAIGAGLAAASADSGIRNEEEAELRRAKAVMHALIVHNDLFALLVEGLVSRWPIGVSCDGAFITAYWSPMKKQYMGVKAPTTHDEVDRMGLDLLYPHLDDRKPDEAVALFLERKHIKVTGYLIIRRETPDYVINLLFALLEQMLALRENDGTLAMARGLMERCESMIRNATMETVKLFSKQQKYRPHAANDVRAIVERLRREDRHDLIPLEFAVARYVLIADTEAASDGFYARGRASLPRSSAASTASAAIGSGSSGSGGSSGKRKSDRMRLLTELATPSPSSATPSPSSASSGWRLDVPYYLDKMAKALANLIFEELIADEMRRVSGSGADSIGGNGAAVARLEKVLTQYRDSLADSSAGIGGASGASGGVGAGSASAKAGKAAIKEAVAILMRPHYTVTGLAREHSARFKHATRMLSDAVLPSSAISQRIVAKAISTCYDRSTPVGSLAEKIIDSESRQALRRTAVIRRSTDAYVTVMRRFPDSSAATAAKRATASPRQQYISLRRQAIGGDLVTTHRAAVVAYGALIQTLQAVDPAFSRQILLARRQDCDITMEALVGCLSDSVRDRLATQIVAANAAMTAFREVVVDKASFDQAVHRLTADH